MKVAVKISIIAEMPENLGGQEILYVMKETEGQGVLTEWENQRKKSSLGHELYTLMLTATHECRHKYTDHQSQLTWKHHKCQEYTMPHSRVMAAFRKSVKDYR